MHPKRIYTKLRARKFWHRDSDGPRPVIAFFARDKRPLALIEYSHARHLVDQVHDLCDDYEREQREKGANA